MDLLLILRLFNKSQSR